MRTAFDEDELLLLPEYDDDDERIASSSSLLPSSSSSSLFQRSHYDRCIAGAGRFGAVMGERYASQLDKITNTNRNTNVVATATYDYIENETGMRVNKYVCVRRASVPYVFGSSLGL